MCYIITGDLISGDDSKILIEHAAPRYFMGVNILSNLLVLMRVEVYVTYVHSVIPSAKFDLSYLLIKAH